MLGACEGLFTPRPLGPSSTSPARSAASCWSCAGPTLRAKNCSARCWVRPARRASCTCWWWRTSTGQTRPPSTCCASSAGQPARTPRSARLRPRPRSTCQPRRTPAMRAPAIRESTTFCVQFRRGWARVLALRASVMACPLGGRSAPWAAIQVATMGPIRPPGRAPGSWLGSEVPGACWCWLRRWRWLVPGPGVQGCARFGAAGVHWPARSRARTGAGRERSRW